jgi:predicted DNA-binding ribbon-helix-helix protein
MRPRAGKSVIVKRSIIIDGHKTSVSLEDAFWIELKKIAHARSVTVSNLIGSVDATREQNNLSSAVRIFVLEQLQKKTNELAPE